MIFILANTSRDAERAAEQHDILRSNWCWLHRANMLAHYREPTILEVGGWSKGWDGGDISAILNATASRDCRVIATTLREENP